MNYLKIFHYSPSQKLRNVYQNEGIKSRESKAYESRKQDLETQKGGEGDPTDDSEGKGGFQADCAGCGEQPDLAAGEPSGKMNHLIENLLCLRR